MAGCGKKKEENKDYIVKVNDETLSLEEFKAIFSDEEWAEMSEEELENHLDKWIKLTLLAQESDKRGLSDLPAVKQRISNSEKKIKANVLIANEVSSIQISENKLLNYYQVNSAEYKQNRKQYKYQRILLNNKEELNQAVNDLKNGMSFKDAAIKYSNEEAGKKGGYMGFIAQKDVHKDLWLALESLSRYNWKSIIYEDGYMLLRWIEKREIDIEIPFSEVKEEIKNKFLKDNQKQIFEELVNELKSGSFIERRKF